MIVDHRQHAFVHEGLGEGELEVGKNQIKNDQIKNKKKSYLEFITISQSVVKITKTQANREQRES